MNAFYMYACKTRPFIMLLCKASWICLISQQKAIQGSLPTLLDCMAQVECVCQLLFRVNCCCIGHFEQHETAAWDAL
jgi:hypothetical protein